MPFPLPDAAGPAKPEDDDNENLSSSALPQAFSVALQSHQWQVQKCIEAWSSRQDSQWIQLLARHDRLEHLLEGLVGKCPLSVDASGPCLRQISPLSSLSKLDPPGRPESKKEVIVRSLVEAGSASTEPPGDPESQNSKVVHRLIGAGSASCGASQIGSHALVEGVPSDHHVHADVRSHWRNMVKKNEDGSAQSQSMARLSSTNRKLLRLLRRIVRSRPYELCIMFVLSVNSLVIGWQTQYAALHHHPPASEDISENVFCAIFLLELLARLASEGFKMYIATDWSWNLFDSVVVATMVAERIASWVSGSNIEELSDISIWRVMRVVRVVRILNVIRVMRFFCELRMMVTSIMRSTKSLIWVVLILSVVFYIFGICLVQGVVAFCRSEDKWDSSDTVVLRDYFGTLDRSFLALFQAMAGGVSWGELLDSLRPLPFAYTVIFLFFIAFAIFGVVNIVTAVFVENAIHNGISDRDTLVEDEMKEKKKYVEKIKVLFQDLDFDGGGTIGLEEFNQAVSDPQTVALINAIGLDITDVQSLFLLLDRDQSGVIDIEEFLVGCLRLKGEARALDFAKVELEMDFLVQAIDNIAADIHAILSNSSQPVTYRKLGRIGNANRLQ